MKKISSLERYVEIRRILFEISGTRVTTRKDEFETRPPVLDDIVGRLAAVMTGTPVVPQKWNGNRASIDYDTAVSHDRAERNRAAQCANATHCSRLEKLPLVTGEGEGNNGGTIVHALENYSRGRRVAPRFRLSGRIGSTRERNERNRGNF